MISFYPSSVQFIILWPFIAGGNGSAMGSPIVGERSPGHQRMMSLGGVAPSSMGYGGGPSSGGGELGFNGEHGKISCLRTASITHGSELSFMEFLDLFKSFRCAIITYFSYFAITWNVAGVMAS